MSIRLARLSLDLPDVLCRGSLLFGMVYIFLLVPALGNLVLYHLLLMGSCVPIALFGSCSSLHKSVGCAPSRCTNLSTVFACWVMSKLSLTPATRFYTLHAVHITSGCVHFSCQKEGPRCEWAPGTTCQQETRRPFSKGSRYTSLVVVCCLIHTPHAWPWCNL